MIKVGIIDSGLPRESVTHFPGKDFTDSNSLIDQLGHGTAVSAPFKDTPCITLVNARVFDQRLVCSSNQIIRALNWLTDQQVHLINMSFGLTTHSPLLEQACQRAQDQGILLVAASPAQGQAVFPAAYDGVVRATGDARCRVDEVSWLNSTQADFGGYPGNPRKGPAGASIGCAFVSAAIAKQMVNTPPTSKTSNDSRLTDLQQCAHYRGVEHYRGVKQRHKIEETAS